MNIISPMQRQPDIRAEAREWVVKFNRDTAPSKTDIADLNAWAKQSPAHRAELQSAEQAWCDGDMLAELAVPMVSPGKRLMLRWFNRLQRALTPNSTGSFVAAAMLLGVTVIGASWYMSMADISANGHYQTAIGEQRTLTLQDQSRIQMDTNSQVRIAYNEGVRQIYLEQGKAHFDVAKNPSRPFEVYAAGGMVRAVGTAFSVFIDNDAVKVTVDEGRVNLARVISAPTKEANQAQQQQIEPEPIDVFLSLDRGQSALFDEQEQALTQLADNELAQELAWRRGLLIFAGEPLAQVVTEVSRYTSTKIEISDPELRQLLIGGRFRTGELEALLDVLQAGFGVQVSYVDSNHIQLRAAAK